MATLFVSDLHLDASAPAATQQFIAFLAHEAASADTLYLLGDLFEAWVGDDDPEPERARVCDALLAAARRGLACFVLHGNRDFLFGSGFEARTGARVLADPVLATVEGASVLLSHGDLLCSDDHSYQELRSIVRQPAWQRRFLALPLEARTLLANEARTGSRAHTSRAIPKIMDVNDAAVHAAFETSGARYLVHGHTHRPGVHEYVVDGAPRTRIVLGAWYEEGSYLRWDATGFSLERLARPSGNGIPHPGP